MFMIDGSHPVYSMAENMLCVVRLDDELVRRLSRIVELIEQVNQADGGTLRSRQAVAMIIEQWERDTLE